VSAVFGCELLKFSHLPSILRLRPLQCTLGRKRYFSSVFDDISRFFTASAGTWGGQTGEDALGKLQDSFNETTDSFNEKSLGERVPGCGGAPPACPWLWGCASRVSLGVGVRPPRVLGCGRAFLGRGPLQCIAGRQS
jgi:hypothetical protein